MELAELIVIGRDGLSRFNYDDYPLCFAEFERKLLLLPELIGDEAAAADALMDELERRREGLSRQQRREAEQQDKQVLALFFTPAALRQDERIKSFALTLCDRWNRRYPRNKYLAGEYEAIMKGFDANLLGLPLRKSKKRGGKV